MVFVVIRCGSCKIIQPEENFTYRDKTRTKRHTRCNRCAATAAKEYYKKRRNRCLSLLCGEHIRCQECGYDTDLRALVFDHKFDDGHIDRGKRRQDGKFISGTHTLKLIEEEPERFQVLCANCNAIKAAEHLEFQFTIRYDPNVKFVMANPRSYQVLKIEPVQRTEG